MTATCATLRPLRSRNVRFAFERDASDYWFDGEPNPPWPIRPVIAGPASPATPEG